MMHRDSEVPRRRPSSTVGATTEALVDAGITVTLFRRHGWKLSTSLPSRQCRAPNTNNQAAVGESILRSNIQQEASESLASQIDRTGMWRACRSWCTLIANFSLPLCTLCTLYAYCAYYLPPMYTFCTRCAYCANIYKQYTLARTGSHIVYTRCKNTHKVC